MPARLTEVIVDCHDLDVVADFWCAVLGYERTHQGDGWQAIGPPGREPTAAELRDAPQPPAMAFVVVPEGKAVKNRIHVDVTPVGATQEAEVERLTALGARLADIGQQDTPWVVMADPEGNEFCVMREATNEEGAGS
jgi:catechol 2,3-dioxygenase-like lactoylglutathione lyase family enzyme